MSPKMKSAGSNSTTLTDIVSKTAKYQAALFILNTILIFSSVVMIFVGYSLNTTYYFDKFYYPNSKLEDFWPFNALPWTLIGIGIATSSIAILGFIFAGTELRPCIIAYAVLLVPIVLGKFGLIYITFQAEKLLSVDSSKLNVPEYHTEAMELYHKNPDFRASWDTLQVHLRCCGGRNFLDFYSKVYPGNKTYTCYPKSCCIANNRGGECAQKERNTVCKIYN